MQNMTFEGLTAPSQHLPAPLVTVLGVDVGNSATKIVGNGWRDRQSSYVVEDPNRKFIDLLGAFTYVSGSRPDLYNRSFIVGDHARVAAPGKGVAIFQDSRGKVNFALQMLLGALSHRKHVEQADIKLVFSTANPADISPQSEALAGSHTVSYKGKQSVINIEVIKGLPEGYGALASQGLSKGKSVVLDLGNGDIGCSIFGLGGKLIDQTRFPGGCSELFQAISESPVFSQYRHGGDVDLIRQALENGIYAYGNTGLSFEAAYKASLQPWAGIALKPAVNFARPHLVTCDRSIAIGGGSLLPGLASSLSKLGVGVAIDPVFASASGMYSLGGAKLASSH